MAGQQPFQFTLSHRISEDTQLQAEEKWILDSIHKIKKQRNCLQIERLQLESLKSMCKDAIKQTQREQSKYVMPAKGPMTFSISMAAPKPESEVVPVVLTTPNSRLQETEEFCNTEPLHLGVGNMFVMDYEEEEEEEENDDDIPLDMNMFMSSCEPQFEKIT